MALQIPKGGGDLCLLIFWVWEKGEGKEKDRSVLNSGAMECESSGEGIEIQRQHWLLNEIKEVLESCGGTRGIQEKKINKRATEKI